MIGASNKASGDMGAYVIEIIGGQVVTRNLSPDRVAQYQAIIDIILGKDGKA